MGRLPRRGPDPLGHPLGQGQPAFERRQQAPGLEPPQQAVAFGPQPVPAFRRGQQPGVVRQDGQECGLGPAQPLRGPPEVEPGGRVEPDDVAAEGGVGGEQGQDGPLRTARLEPQGQHGLGEFLEIGPRPVLAGQPHDLHGQGAGPALDPSRPEVLAHGPDERQRVDAGVGEEALVLEPDQDFGEALRDPFARREAPLAVGRRPGPEQLAARAEERRRDGVVEADDRYGEPEQPARQQQSARRDEPPARLQRTISIHCPFVLAWTDASYMASTAMPGW